MTELKDFKFKTSLTEVGVFLVRREPITLTIYQPEITLIGNHERIGIHLDVLLLLYLYL